MQVSDRSRAIDAATSIVVAHGLPVDDAIVLHDSNKLALRVLPADVVARIAPATEQVLQFEVDLAQLLAAAGSPVAALDPRVEPRAHERDGFVLTFWTHYATDDREISAAEYADALERLHAGMRTVELPTPRWTDRVDEAQQLVAVRESTPKLAEPDREFVGDTLRSLRQTIERHGDAEQVLHGEPHPGNVLATDTGALFIDLETCCRGPIEFDLAHAPDDVAEHYPGVDRELLDACRVLVLAMITAWRWDRNDQFPDGRQLGRQWLTQLRAAGERGSGAPGGRR